MPPKLSVDKVLSQAAKAARAGDNIGAIAAFQQVLDRFPSNKRAQKGLTGLRPVALPSLLKQAQNAQHAGAWAEAERVLRAAAALAPDMAPVGLSLAMCQLEMGKAPAALATVTPLLKQDPQHPELLNAQGRAFREMGQTAQAKAAFEAALGHPDTDAITYNNLGILARAVGDRPGARAAYERALELAPENAEIHRNLSVVLDYAETPAHLDTLQERAAAHRKDDPAVAPILFALFRALDQLDRRQDAFAHLERANRLIKGASGYDFQSDAIPYALTRALFREAPAAVPETSHPVVRPIFVTGLPRSGTTLVESMLARCPGVKPCGELTVVQNALSPLLKDVMSRDNKALETDDILELQQTLRDGLAAFANGASVMIDKMPLNFRWIGYICAALPEARIVHLERDPMAVAWSLYRHAFRGGGNGFAYDPADIARFMVLHRDQMAHWRTLVADRIFDLGYEALVADPEKGSRALAQAVGLEWSEDWLSPEKATHQVLTASSDQVRRPIYQNGNDDWQRYRSQLEPLVRALSDAGILSDPSQA